MPDHTAKYIPVNSKRPLFCTFRTEPAKSDRHISGVKSAHIPSFLLQSSLTEGELELCFYITALQLCFLYHNSALPTL